MDLQLEKLSADLIDEDFAKVFYGFHFAQAITGRLSVHIKYGFATAPSKLYFFYSIAIWSAAILSTFVTILQCEVPDNGILIDFYYKITQIINLCLTLVTVVQDIKGNSSSDFYVKLHKIDKDLNFKDGKEYNKNLARYTVPFVIVTFIAGTSLSTILFNIYCVKDFCPSAVLILWGESSTVWEMIIIAFIMYYISIRISYINLTLKALKDKTRNEICSERFMLDEQSDSLDETVWNDLLNGMNSILTVIADFIDLHQYQIFSYTCQMMTWIMVAIQCCITKIKNQLALDDIMITATIAGMMILMKAIFFALSMAADLLSNKLEKTRQICVHIRHTLDDSISRRNAKRMLLLLEAKHDLSIYDIYTLGSRVSVQLLAIIATYTIVLLQLALV